MKRAAILTALGLATLALTAAAHPGARGAGFLERLQAADTDRNGTLDRGEAQALPRLGRNFEAIDANRDGRVTLDELKAYRQQARARRWQAVDTNADGRLSRDEFLARAAQRFERLDANHDGFISAEEMPRGKRHGHGQR